MIVPLLAGCAKTPLAIWETYPSDWLQWDRSFATRRSRQTIRPLGHQTSQSLMELLIFCLPDFMLTYCR